MNVFISWSGPTSKVVAQSLHDWLKQVIQAVDPWISPEIEKGARWSQELTEKLKDARTGIICLTPDNLREPWILFEAGALSRTVESPYVCPYLFRVKPADLTGPLAQFQATRAEKEDTRKLVRTINGALEGKLSDTHLNGAFEKWWPDLEAQLAKVPQPEVQQSPRRSDREILEEMLALLREQTRAREAQERREAFDRLVGEPGFAALSRARGRNLSVDSLASKFWEAVQEEKQKKKQPSSADDATAVSGSSKQKEK